jgi:hypothetical protein
MSSSTATLYEYAVRDRTGAIVKGKLEAPSQAAVAQKLKSMGYAPISITESGAGMSRELSIPGFGGRVKLKDLAVMSRQFATMINSGLSLLRSLTILQEQTENKKLAEALAAVRADVEAGQSLSSGLSRHPTIFPPLMVNMTKAGEVGGFLDKVLLQIATNFESEVTLRGKVKAATVAIHLAALVDGQLRHVQPLAYLQDLAFPQMRQRLQAGGGRHVAVGAQRALRLLYACARLRQRRRSLLQLITRARLDILLDGLAQNIQALQL